MAEYIERDAAISYIKDNQCKRCSDIGLCGKCAVLTAIKLFESIPAADVRPVVLCRDCRYAYDSVDGWCCSYGVCVDCIVREDFFCADGEKREES